MIMKRYFVLIFILAFSLAIKTSGQEQAEKIVNHNAQFWISTNNQFRISERWALLNDIHIRRTDFISEPNFYFLRFGAQYYIKPNVRVAGGYAHLWLTTQGNWDAFQNEKRIYQQFSISQRYDKLNALFRLRTEQRFFNNVVDGTSLNDDFMVHRTRFLISVGFPLKPNGNTQFIVADEIHLNFGKNVVYNTFNQNRLTVGIKQKINQQWSFDFGYMMVYQQLAAGNTYNLNHTLRLFFYGSFDFRKNKKDPFNPVRHGEE
jgi:hypothetical protein